MIRIQKAVRLSQIANLKGSKKLVLEPLAYPVGALQTMKNIFEYFRRAFNLIYNILSVFDFMALVFIIVTIIVGVYFFLMQLVL